MSVRQTVSTEYSDAIIDQMMFWTFLAEASFSLMLAGIVGRYWRRSFPLQVVEVMFGVSAAAAFVFYKLRVAIVVALAFATAQPVDACGAKDLHDAHRMDRLALTNKNVQEENKSSGFHLFELHVPTMGTTVGFFTLIFVAAVAFAWYYLRNKKRSYKRTAALLVRENNDENVATLCHALQEDFKSLDHTVRQLAAPSAPSQGVDLSALAALARHTPGRAVTYALPEGI